MTQALEAPVFLSTGQREIWFSSPRLDERCPNTKIILCMDLRGFVGLGWPFCPICVRDRAFTEVFSVLGCS